MLTQPLLAEAHKGVTERCDSYALAITDWSAINFGKHQSKKDRKPRYELQTSLLLNDQNGEPLAPIVQNVVKQEGVWSSYHDERIQLEPHLDELTSRMKWIQRQAFAKPVVHIIDREAASIGHQREGDEAGWWLVLREKAGSTVEFNQRQVKLGEVADTHEVLIKGKKATQYVAQTEVTITRPAKPKKWVDGKRVKPIKGKPLTLRLIVSRIIDDAGYVLAEWIMLSNRKSVSAQVIALWYYY